MQFLFYNLQGLIYIHLIYSFYSKLSSLLYYLYSFIPHTMPVTHTCSIYPITS